MASGSRAEREGFSGVDHSDRDEVLRLHSERYTVLERARNRLVAYLESECHGLSEDDGDFHHRLIEARVKAPSSIIRTLDDDGLGPDRLWSDVNDLIGARVVVVTKRMAEKLRDRLANVSEGPFAAPLVKNMDIPERGYRAIHLKGQYKTRDGDLGWEVQIRTELEDFWGVVTRSDFYKGGAIPADATGMARTLSDQLKTVHDMFEWLQERIREGRRTIPVARPEAESGGVPGVPDLPHSPA